MARPERKRGAAQAWIELAGSDPEAWSALSVARARLPAARGLESLRRWRLVELGGSLPGAVPISASFMRLGRRGSAISCGICTTCISTRVLAPGAAAKVKRASRRRAQK